MYDKTTIEQEKYLISNKKMVIKETEIYFVLFVQYFSF